MNKYSVTHKLCTEDAIELLFDDGFIVSIQKNNIEIRTKTSDLRLQTTVESLSQIKRIKLSSLKENCPQLYIEFINTHDINLDDVFYICYFSNPENLKQKYKYLNKDNRRLFIAGYSLGKLQ